MQFSFYFEKMSLVVLIKPRLIESYESKKWNRSHELLIKPLNSTKTSTQNRNIKKY